MPSWKSRKEALSSVLKRLYCDSFLNPSSLSRLRHFISVLRWTLNASEKDLCIRSAEDR